jgi:hypothetical protein
MIHIKRVLLLLIFRRPSVEVFMEPEQGLGSGREVKSAPHSPRRRFYHYLTGLHYSCFAPPCSIERGPVYPAKAHVASDQINSGNQPPGHQVLLISESYSIYTMDGTIP